MKVCVHARVALSWSHLFVCHLWQAAFDVAVKACGARPVWLGPQPSQRPHKSHGVVSRQLTTTCIAPTERCTCICRMGVEIHFQNVCVHVQRVLRGEEKRNPCVINDGQTRWWASKWEGGDGMELTPPFESLPRRFEWTGAGGHVGAMLSWQSPTVWQVKLPTNGVSGVICAAGLTGTSGDNGVSDVV